MQLARQRIRWLVGQPVVVVRVPKKKVCAFCKDKTQYVDYKDTNMLRKFISDRG
ncbi:hypothetical protein ACWEA7_45790, partial [Streptomyces sp. NPDC005093]